MAARLELVVLCAVALLAAVTPTDARRFGGATFLGRGSYSSSRDVSVPAYASRAGSDLLSSILEDEKAQIMKEADNSRHSKPAHPKSSPSPARRSPSPTRRSPPPVKRSSAHRRSPSPSRGIPSWFGPRTSRSSRSRGVGTRAEARNGNGFATAESSVRTSGGGLVTTKGHASAGVGGSAGTGSRSYARHSVYGRG